jgi:hypothetical protein
MKTYIDKATCPDGHRFAIRRKRPSVGHLVSTRCTVCKRDFKAIAGPLRQPKIEEPKIIEKKRSLRESDIEAYLNKRVKELGGESRKVRWIGRNSAPDRIVMLPGRAERKTTVAEVKVFAEKYDIGIIQAMRELKGAALPAATIWIEVKAPGKGATFPANAHERAQFREHERMRKMGQRVEVVDCYERVDEVLK